MSEKIMENDFSKIITNIKNEIRITRVKTIQQANSNLIAMYFRIGKILAENSKYGNGFIENISKTIRLECSNVEGFSTRNLKRMKRFYNEYKDFEIVPQAVAQLPWGHNIILFEKVPNKNVRMFYADAAIKNGWSRNVLALQIESNYHERVGKTINNFNDDLINDTFKDPYIFDFLTLKERYAEKELESAMVERIKEVLMELGKGFSFVGNQYKISTDDNDYYIDLLFYHLQLRRYVVVELKVTEFRPEYIGQLGFYVKAIDETLKGELDDPTIGLLLCREKDRLSAKWALGITNLPIGISTYELGKYIPSKFLEQLPTEDDLNLHV